MHKNSFTISGLKRKRGEIAGQLLILEGQARCLRADLSAVDHTLCLLDPLAKPHTIKVLKPRHRFKYFEAGELARLIFDQLRNAKGNPVLVPALTAAVMDAKGLDKKHRDAVREISARVLAQLHSLAKRGRIERIGRRVGVSWILPPQ
jgi:hypothetical protein